MKVRLSQGSVSLASSCLAGGALWNPTLDVRTVWGRFIPWAGLLQCRPGVRC